MKNHELHNPDRYEGLLDEPNAKFEVDVLGFFGFRGGLDAGTADKLHILYFSGTAEPGFIQVREISSETNYVMQSKDDPGGGARWREFAWPVKPVIQKNEIDPRDLGVIVRLGSDQDYGPELAPALFFGGQAPRFPVNPVTYDLILRVQYSLTDLRYDIRTGNQLRMSCHYSPSQPCGPPPIGKELRIEAESPIHVHFTLKDPNPVDVSIHLEGTRVNSSNKLIANYRFHHQPTR